MITHHLEYTIHRKKLFYLIAHFYLKTICAVTVEALTLSPQFWENLQATIIGNLRSKLTIRQWRKYTIFIKWRDKIVKKKPIFQSLHSLIHLMAMRRTKIKWMTEKSMNYEVLKWRHDLEWLIHYIILSIIRLVNTHISDNDSKRKIIIHKQKSDAKKMSSVQCIDSNIVYLA